MTYFILYSFIGWLIQSIYLSFRSRSLINAGFLILPFCPIYGLHMMFLIAFVYPHSLPLPLLFLACFATAAVLEYFTSLIFDQVFGVLLWNYSDCQYNVNGRIVIPWSVFFGASTAFVLLFVHPEIDRYQLPAWVFYFILVASIAIHADFMYGVDTLLLFKHRLAEMTVLRKKFRNYLRHSNVCETPRELLELNIHASALIDAVHRKGIFAESYSDIPAGQLAAELALIKTRHENLSRPTFTERRLLGAFPLLKVYNEAASMSELQLKKI